MSFLATTKRNLRKGWLARMVEGELVSRFYFQLNPTEKTDTRNVNYTFNSPPGSPLPTAIFGNVSGDEIAITLLLDATMTYDAKKEGVSAQRALLASYTEPDLDRYLNVSGIAISPPELLFGFGKDFLHVVLKSINFRDVMFNNDLYPIRTYAELSMQAVFKSFELYQARLNRLRALRDMVVIKEKFDAAL